MEKSGGDMEERAEDATDASGEGQGQGGDDDDQSERAEK